MSKSGGTIVPPCPTVGQSTKNVKKPQTWYFVQKQISESNVRVNPRISLFLFCKNLNSIFSTWLTHLIPEGFLHSWLFWPTVCPPSPGSGASEVGYHRHRHTYLNLISKLPWGKKVRVMYSESFVILVQSNLGVVDFSAAWHYVWHFSNFFCHPNFSF